jgi:hypothetical protein
MQGSAGLPDLRDEPSLEDALGTMEEAMGEGSDGSGGSYSGPAGSGEAEGGSGTGGQPGGKAGGGPLTRAEQVAILDDQLERGTGEFDDMILEEQTAQRSAAREQASTAEPGQGDNPAAATGGGYGPEGGVAGAGGYSTGGGMGGASRGGGAIPPNTAKFPPPADIPDGDDDDVVARQLREAAMREPDPAVREKLWDEYRKYKGIER